MAKGYFIAPHVGVTALQFSHVGVRHYSHYYYIFIRVLVKKVTGSNPEPEAFVCVMFASSLCESVLSGFSGFLEESSDVRLSQIGSSKLSSGDCECLSMWA